MDEPSSRGLLIPHAVIVDDARRDRLLPTELEASRADSRLNCAMGLQLLQGSRKGTDCDVATNADSLGRSMFRSAESDPVSSLEATTDLALIVSARPATADGTGSHSDVSSSSSTMVLYARFGVSGSMPTLFSVLQ